jgi:CubicO group peptidase (beta-lactamase class C family)
LRLGEETDRASSVGHLESAGVGGMSEPVLSRISEVMDSQVEASEISGAITAVAIGGRTVHLATHGWRDIEERVPMPADAIFRMASSTKPVIGVAVMQQMEAGRISPNDPVNKFIPEFRDTQVALRRRPAAESPDDDLPDGVPGPAAREGAEGSATGPTEGVVDIGIPTGAGRAGRNDPPPEVDLVPAHRDILVRDLLTHTSGLLSGGAGTHVSDLRRGPEDTLASYIPRLGAVPLDFQPGSRWQYSPGTGIDVLGHIVELVSGQPLDAYLQDNIFAPVGMVDTFFSLPDDRRSRLLPLYRRTESGLEKVEGRTANRMSSSHYFSGSGGLQSTAADYLRFEQMLTGQGSIDGRQVLRPESVQLMATNHVGDLFRGLREPARGLGFGFTVQVVLDAEAARSQRSNGAFGWGGAFGTMTWSDPTRHLSGVFMVQQPNLVVRARFERAVKQAVDALGI